MDILVLEDIYIYIYEIIFIEIRLVRKMSILVVVTYAVKPGKHEEYMSLMKKLRKYKDENSELFKEVKSWRIFTQIFGAIADAYKDTLEFDTMADFENYLTKITNDEGYKKIYEEIIQLVDPATCSQVLWKFVI